MSFTPEQKRAVEARGEVLVSASAGAGKTTVMIKRLADILEGGASLDGVLAVTFTKKAAAQMKEKLRRELISRLNTDDAEKRENIRVQLGKINTADISTIHSFCARLIRTYFYAVGVDSSFEVLADGAEANALRARAMDELFDKLYAENSPDLLFLLSRLRKKRSDGAIREMLLSAYDEVRQRPDYDAILARCLNETYTEEGFLKVRAELGALVAEKYKILASAVEKFELGFYPAENRAGYIRVLEEMRVTLAELAEEQNVFLAPSKLSSAVKPRVKPQTAEADAAFADFADGIKKRYKSLTKDLEEEQTERQRFFDSGEVAKAFVRLLMAFVAAYDGVKREEGKLDYGDLEHCALALLNGADGDVRETVRQKYEYVFVDEYQDVNPIQDKLITAVAGGDVFCVGDLKQAIYGFRGSRSRFFAEKCGYVGGRGEYVVLPDNFRSSRNVISFVNNLFSKIMQPPVCEFDYADGHAMRGGARYAEGRDGVAQICLFEGAEYEKPTVNGVYSVASGGAASKGYTAEGLAVLQLVEEALKGEHYDPDLGKTVKTEAGDICVLTRKRANKSAQGIIRALSSKYPVAGAAEVNICERPEIIRLLDVLKYLDNGSQDVPLVTSLLSPLGGLTERELAAVRVYVGGGREAPTFSECCKIYAARVKDGVADKLNAFFALTEGLRSLAESIGAAKLIDEIMRTGDFSSAFDTERKLSALRRLQREAYSPSGELYLNAFLAKIRAGGNKVTAPATLAADCIKFMTMHASKGLEFPVVIVADIAASFAGDGREDMPFDDDFGFAPRCYGAADRTYKNTLLRRLYKLRGEREELSNEINLFYVACTRAKYALYVLTSQAPDYDEVKANFTDNYAELFDVKAFTPRILSVQPVSVGNNGEVRRVLDESRADGQTLAALQEIGAYSYGFEEGVELPVKSSASRLLAMRGGDENAVLLFDEQAERGADTGIDAGLAYHRYLELCDFSVKDAAGIEAQIARFVGGELISAEQRKLLNVSSLVKILAMPAFGFTEGEIYREREFVCKLPSYDFRALSGGGKAVAVGEDDGNGVIVQGALDLLRVVRRDGKILYAEIVDYKYTSHSDEYVKNKYAPQLALYRSVVSKIYKIDESAVKTIIINIRACRQVDMGGED